MNCPYCLKEVKPAMHKCVCGCPATGTPEEVKTFLNTRLIVIKNDIDQSERHLKVARYFIIGVAALAFYQMAFNMANNTPGGIHNIQGVLGAVFVGLAILFLRSPVLISITALVLSVFILPFSIISFIVLIFLGIGLYFAVEARRAAKKQESIRKLLEQWNKHQSAYE